MTLAEFAIIVGADTKWLLNAAAQLGLSGNYTLAKAERLATTKALTEGPGAALPYAYSLAGEALRRHVRQGGPVLVGHDAGGTVAASVDVARVLAAVHTRRSRVATMYAPRQRGRQAARQDSVKAAASHGLDISLLRANLRLTPEQRVRQLDGMVSFAAGVRRTSPQSR